jgi:hypothetical protein
VDVKDFFGKPKAGVVINEDSPLVRRNGLHIGDVIVAIEGMRVDTFEQYCFVRNLSDAPKFRLIVYHGGNYRDVAAQAENRRFGVDMKTFK